MHTYLLLSIRAEFIFIPTTESITALNTGCSKSKACEGMINYMTVMQWYTK